MLELCALYACFCCNGWASSILQIGCGHTNFNSIFSMWHGMGSVSSKLFFMHKLIFQLNILCDYMLSLISFDGALLLLLVAAIS